MEKKKVKIWILHAGIGHTSPYFYNLCNSLKKYNEYEIIVYKDLPLDIKAKNDIIYFNRLKRYYDSDDINSINNFLNKVKKLKKLGWKLIFTLHNFFPIDRNINKNDEYLLRKFLELMDAVFVFSNYMHQSLKNNFGIESTIQYIGNNTLNESFDSDLDLSILDNANFVFTFIGNISEYKKLDEVIKCFKKINKKNIYLLIAGPSNSRYNLEINDTKNIIRADKFITDNMWNYICEKTNVIINTYDVNRDCFKYGFFPSNCVEIVKHKKVCIAPNCDEIKEIIPEGYCYYYDDNLLEIMKKVIKEKEFIKIKEKTYPNYKYDWDIVAERIINKVGELK